MGGVSMEWKVFSLSDIAHYSQGKQIPLNLQYLELNELRERFIRIVDFTSNWSQEPRFVDKDPKYLVNIDDIVMIRYGTPGKVFRGHKGIIANNLFKITFNEEIIDKDYAYWYLNQDSVYKQLMAGQSSSTMPAITFGMLKYIMVRVPPISYQRRIASILSSLDRKIELNNKINADLEEMAQAIFKNWFVDFEPFKDGKFVDSELGMIPEGWKVGTLGDITKNKSAKVKERNDVKVLSPVTNGELVLSEEYFTKQVFSSSIAKYKIVNKGDFAYNPARVNIGSLGRNEFDFDGCVSPVYVVFSVLDGYENYFDLFRKTDFFKDSVASLAIGGVRQSLSYDDLSLIETIIPSENIVEEFNNLYNEMKKTIKTNKLENSRLSLLRDTLLPRLMSGELEVPE